MRHPRQTLYAFRAYFQTCERECWLLALAMLCNAASACRGSAPVVCVRAYAGTRACRLGGRQLLHAFKRGEAIAWDARMLGFVECRPSSEGSCKFCGSH